MLGNEGVYIVDGCEGGVAERSGGVGGGQCRCNDVWMGVWMTGQQRHSGRICATTFVSGTSRCARQRRDGAKSDARAVAVAPALYSA